jgi:RIO kinase 1
VTRIYEHVRPAPPGIIQEGYLEDVDLGVIKQGKEAKVHLVERIAPDRSCLLARKVYIPIGSRSFRNDAVYRQDRRLDSALRRDGDRMRRSRLREQAAMDSRSRFGRDLLRGSWIQAEWTMLGRLWEAGCPVPYPVAATDDGFLMEYIGDEEVAAPRLVHAKASREALPGLFEQARAAVLAMARAGVVHADLSPYNILVWQERLWVIDLPQAVSALTNLHATDFLHRDCLNVAGWFARRGLEIDGEDLFVEALNELFAVKMEDAFHARGT